MNIQKTWAIIIGIVLLLTGVLGFVMSSPLLGLVAVNALHNVVHLLTGAIFLWAGLSESAPTKKVNQWLGVVYVLVAILGFFGLLTFLDVMGGMDFDNWLHLGIGLVSALIGWMVD
jgi:hypothetical protein